MYGHGIYTEDGRWHLLHAACHECEKVLRLLPEDEAVETYREVHDLPQEHGFATKVLRFFGI